ncbi:hypothetical protein CEXT_686651 [Caerostris extrusa]|uniref:Uncharacterized protein n=1 Tax=Caerostris extrusa TaxID=172846 RepID=A0AAV4QTS7_CAEEX|nr:hypothetical protein CEXT_686651 [Caerostris extrusa]
MRYLKCGLDNFFKDCPIKESPTSNNCNKICYIVFMEGSFLFPRPKPVIYQQQSLFIHMLLSGASRFGNTKRLVATCSFSFNGLQKCTSPFNPGNASFSRLWERPANALRPYISRSGSDVL